MKKPFLILISLFGLSSIFLGAHAQINVTSQPPPVECRIGYYNVAAPPECTTTTGPDGKPEEVCTAVGPASFLWITNKNEPNFSEVSFPLLDIDWSGTCRCNLWVYSGFNLNGFWKRYPFSMAKEKKILVSNIWRREANSFKVTCTF